MQNLHFMTFVRNDHSVTGSSSDRALIVKPGGLPPPKHQAVKMRSLQTNSFGDGSVRFFQGSSPLLSVHPISESRGTQFSRECYFEAQIAEFLYWAEHVLKGKVSRD